jgi:hypothetical protein
MDCRTVHKIFGEKFMTPSSLSRFAFRSSVLAALLSLAAISGCKKAPIDDATLTTNVRTALSNDASINKEPIQPTVVNGVVTLTGNVSNDTARIVAAQDSAKVEGVKEVVNALTIQGLALAPTITTPEAPAAPRTATPEERKIIAAKQPLPPPPPPAQAPAPAPVAPKPPPAPVIRNISVPAGAGVSVRINQTLDSATSQEGDSFSGIVTSNVLVNGEVAIPAGSGVSGRVVGVHEAGHYKGNSMLSVALTSINRRGERITVATDPYTLEGKGRGKNTAAKIGGGAAIGAVLGGIFGGGKGAAIGAGVGGGGGAVMNGVTRGQQVQIASETVVRFHLANGITVRSLGRSDDPDDNAPQPDDSGLQRR